MYTKRDRKENVSRQKLISPERAALSDETIQGRKLTEACLIIDVTYKDSEYLAVIDDVHR